MSLKADWEVALEEGWLLQRREDEWQREHSSRQEGAGQVGVEARSMCPFKR